jgi:hypothetical protein
MGEAYFAIGRRVSGEMMAHADKTGRGGKSIPRAPKRGTATTALRGV